MRLLLKMLSVALLLSFAAPAFADIAVDPCDGATAGAACTMDSGGSGTCVDNGGTLECQAAATNNGTNNGSNNGTQAASNNGTSGTTNNGTIDGTPNSTNSSTTSGKSEDDKGCSTVGLGGGAPSLLVFALLFSLRRRRR